MSCKYPLVYNPYELLVQGFFCILLKLSRNMSKEMAAEKQEYIEKLVAISWERAV